MFFVSFKNKRKTVGVVQVDIPMTYELGCDRVCTDLS